MENKAFTMPTDKRAMTVVCVIGILMAIIMIGVAIFSFVPEEIPEDAVEIICSFQSYEIKKHTKSSTYDLLLYSEEYDQSFKFSFFDGYSEQISPRQLCTGQVYSIVASRDGVHYTIYELSGGNLHLTKKEAYMKSQLGACIALSVISVTGILVFALYLAVLHHPERFSERLKKFLFKPKRSI